MKKKKRPQKYPAVFETSWRQFFWNFSQDFCFFFPHFALLFLPQRFHAFCYQKMFEFLIDFLLLLHMCVKRSIACSNCAPATHFNFPFFRTFFGGNIGPGNYPKSFVLGGKLITHSFRPVRGEKKEDQFSKKRAHTKKRGAEKFMDVIKAGEISLLTCPWLKRKRGKHIR